MIGILRKYQQSLWWIVAIVVIASVLVFFQPGQGGARGALNRNLPTLYGKPLLPEQVQEADRQARLAAIVRFGGEDSPEARKAGFNHVQETYQRLLLKAKIRDLGIRVDDAAVANWIRENLKDPKTGALDYTGFINRVLVPRNYSAVEFEEYIRQDLSLRHLIDVVGVSAELVTPREAEGDFRQEYEQASASIVIVSSSNYLAGISSETPVLQQFFTNHLGEYRIPERFVVSYVRWEGTNYLATAEAEMEKIPGIAGKLEQYYTERGADTFKDENGAVLTKEAALNMIRKQSALAEANRAASAAARDFANELYAMEPAAADNLAKLAEKKGLHLSQSAPFTEFGVVQGLEDFPRLGQDVAKLTPEQPFSRPLEGARGAIVVSLQGRLPFEIPPFSSVENRVRDDHRRFAAREAARNAGMAFAAAVTNGLAHGGNFRELADASKLTTIDLSPFSIASDSIVGLPENINPNQVKDTVFNLKPGTSSRFVPTADGGFIAFLKALNPVEESLVKAGLNSYVEDIRRRRRQEVIEAWLRHEMQSSGLGAILKDQGSL